MSVTLKSIASQVGVSPMTVSAALHDIAGIRISDAKRELIRKTAREMGYRPNLLARTLSGGGSRIIGVVIDSEAPASLFAILCHIEKEATLAGYRLMVAEGHDSLDTVVAAHRTFEQYGAEGVICMAHDYPDQRDRFQQYFRDKQRLVLLEKAPGLEHPYIEIDQEPAFREVIGHWQKQGKNIGYIISDLPYFSQQNMLKAYRAACAGAGIAAQLFHPAFSLDSRQMIGEMNRCLDEFILPNRIDAALIQNDRYGAAMLSALHARNLRCPDDLALVGKDNSDYCDMLLPPLASIDSNHAASGKQMVRLLLELIAGRSPAPEYIPSRIVWRESAGV